MPPGPANASAPSLRLSELLASVSLATDAGTGQPIGHALRTCAIATALARDLAWDDEAVRVVHQATLLRFLGCTSDAAETAAMTGGNEQAFVAAMAPVVMGSTAQIVGRLVRSVGADQRLGRRLRLVAAALTDPDGGRRSMSAHCEVGSALARRVGLADPVVEALAHAYERFDGRGFPDGLAGDAIPPAVRVFVVARDADLAATLGEDALAWVRERRGRAYDPEVVAAFERVGPDAIASLEGADEWDLALDAEPEPKATVGPEHVDRLLLAFADFADLKSPWLRGHSRRVAVLAERAGRHAKLGEADRTVLRRAGWVHDVGRVGIETGVWDHARPLTRGQRERMNLHAYLTQRILERCPALAPLVEPAVSHHERLDGTGYHRSLGADAQSKLSRIVAAADVYAALTADRPHRSAYDDDSAARLLEAEAPEHLCPDAVACVLAAAGQRPAPRRNDAPAGLTEREIQVLCLIARGRSNKAVAQALSISPKTVGRHVENLYNKLGVSSRAAAALFAVEHDLLERH